MSENAYPRRAPFDLARFTQLTSDWEGRVHFSLLSARQMKKCADFALQLPAVPLLWLTDQQVAGQGVWGALASSRF